MSGAVAFVIGACALSFAAGCVLTAVMLRREPPEPEVGPAPGPAAGREPRELRWPPEDYVSRPIHRNPVIGLPTVPPERKPTRPVLALVPDVEVEEPVVLDRVRRMHVVPALPEPDQAEADQAEQAESDRTGPTLPEPAGTEPAAPEPVRTEPAVPEPVLVEVPAHPGPDPGPGAPAPAAEQPSTDREPAAEPPTRPFPLPDATEFRLRYLRTFEDARRKSNS
ncbi:hypothetical protein [Saccharothrix syringae]|uniref:Uncharacterized protein n=1 Tax=Saccharothrix syringae TaxID=103733 RepID=A0A5Q0HAA0_SACSY|nr:hypothetical protein [Saccharothrix syringae]QFZ22884.1 hypothetical protein EKG83_40545 [Saccharothrix syringae]